MTIRECGYCTTNKRKPINTSTVNTVNKRQRGLATSGSEAAAEALKHLQRNLEVTDDLLEWLCCRAVATASKLCYCARAKGHHFQVSIDHQRHFNYQLRTKKKKILQ